MTDTINTTMCKHQKLIRVPGFPSDVLVCKDCGAEGCKAGYEEHGIRDYFVPGDPPWRRRSDCRKLEWLQGGDDLTQCTNCCFVGTIDDFDVMGAEDGNLFCNRCGAEFEPEDCCPLHVADLEPQPSGLLF